MNVTVAIRVTFRNCVLVDFFSIVSYMSLFQGLKKSFPSLEERKQSLESTALEFRVRKSVCITSVVRQ
jgi:hypothetical protein